MAMSNIRRTLRGDFLKLWIGQLISNFGDQFFFMAIIGIILFDRGMGAEYAALMMVAMSVPALIFGPIAGSYVDRWNRKKTMIVADILRATIVFSLIFYGEIWYMFLSLFILSSLSRFFFPARNAIIPQIVDEELLLSANSMSQMTNMLSMIIGPAIGAAIVGILGGDTAILLDVVSFFMSALFIYVMRYSGAVEGKVETAKRLWKETTDGLKFCWQNRIIRHMLLMTAIIMAFLGGLNPIFMIYIRDVLGMNLMGFGIIDSAQGLGSLIASIALTVIGSAFSKKSIVFSGIMMVSIPVMLITFVHHTFIVIETLSLVGIGVVFFDTPITTLMQEAAPDRIRGRVFGAFGAILQVAILVSMGIEGVLADMLGATTVIFYAGLLSVLFTIFFFSFRSVRSSFDYRPEEDKSEQDIPPHHDANFFK